MMGLPDEFLHSHNGKGGGILQGSASECVLVAILASREHNLKRLQSLYPEMTSAEIRGRMIGYSSDQSNSAIEKSGMLGAVPIRLLKADENGSLTGEILAKALKEDLAAGKFPIICIATLGTTGTCAFDNIPELGPICRENNIWLHIDAAYAGAAFVCPEYQHHLAGIEFVDSYNMNLHKWMEVNFDCTVMWLRNSDNVADSFTIDRIYLKHQYEGKTAIPDFRHWQIPLGRKFRAVKVWLVLRTLGVETLRSHIRRDVGLAKYFENLLIQDDRFEIVTKATMGLLSFCLKNGDEATKELLENITERKQIYMIPATVNGKYVIRFAVCGRHPKESDMDFAFNEIRSETDKLQGIEKVVMENGVSIDKLNEKFTKELNVTNLVSEKIK